MSQMKRIIKFVFILMLFCCKAGVKTPLSGNSLEDDLKSRNILLLKSKNKVEVNQVQIYRSSNVKDFYLIDICQKYTIKSIVFESENLAPNFLFNAESCDWSALEALYINANSINVNQICLFFKDSQSKEKSLNLTKVSVQPSIKQCFLSVPSMNGFSIDYPIDFTGEQFCDLVPYLKNITFFRSFDTPFTKKHLQCLLGMPNLKDLMLQRWKGATTKDFQDLVDQYEKKYNRKLQADVDDPRGYEFNSNKR